jgi:Flp pilus assembly pilin Flp
MKSFIAAYKEAHRTGWRASGQGLVEYALILVLVSAVVILVLTTFGGTVSNSFCGVISAFNNDVLVQCAEDVVQITSSDYNAGQKRLKLQATTDGGYSADVTLIASPGGTMSQQGNHYAITIENLDDCPCTVTVRSSKGGRDSVTVP